MKMVSDFRLVLLTTVACFQLVLTADPPAIAYVDFKDRMPTGSLYLARPLIEPPTAAMARYFSSKGIGADQVRPVDKRFSEFLGGRRRRFSEFLGGKKRFSEFLGGRKRFSEFLGGRKRFSEFLGGKRNALSLNNGRFT